MAFILNPPKKIEKEEGKSFSKIVGMNLLIFGIYYVIAFTTIRTSLTLAPFGAMYFWLWPLHVIVNVILGFVYSSKKDYKSSAAFFASGVIILLVGFGSCFFFIVGGL